MRGDILEIRGLPLEFWSHPDVLNCRLQHRRLRESERSPPRHGRPHRLGQSAPCCSAPASPPTSCKNLSPRRSAATTALTKTGSPTDFSSTPARTRSSRFCPRPTPDQLARRRPRRSCNTTTVSASPPGSIRCATDYVLQAYKMLADHGELISEVVAFPQVLAKDPAAELAAVQKTRETLQKRSQSARHRHQNLRRRSGRISLADRESHASPTKTPAATAIFSSIPQKFAELCIAADKQGLDHPRARHWRRRR